MKKDVKVIMIICVVAIIVVALIFIGRTIVINLPKEESENETKQETTENVVKDEKEKDNSNKLSKKEQEEIKEDLMNKTVDFVQTCVKDSLISYDAYEDLIEKLEELGLNAKTTFKIERVTEGPGSKSNFTVGDVKGENAYETIEDTEIKEILDDEEDYELKEGDVINLRITTDYEYVSGDYSGMVQ